MIIRKPSIALPKKGKKKGANKKLNIAKGASRVSPLMNAYGNK